MEPSYVYLPGIPGGEEIVKLTGCDFFSVPIELGATGAKQAFNVVSSANEYEKKLLEAAYAGLSGNISKGVEFIKNPAPK